jgi:hypothetical protein
MTEIEEELREFAKFQKDPEAFPNRQKYLVALLRAVSNTADKDTDGWDAISDEAADWYDDCTEAQGAKKPLPDFDLMDTPSDEEATEPDEPEPAEEGDESEEQESEAEAGEAEITETAEAEAEAPEAYEAQEEPEPPSSTAAKPKRGKKPKPKRTARVYSSLEKDKWGITKGTKASEAMALYETGEYTRAEVTEKLQGKHYNPLREAAKAGHRVDINPATKKVKATHKDDLDKKPKAKKAKKAKEPEAE